MSHKVVVSPSWTWPVRVVQSHPNKDYRAVAFSHLSFFPLLASFNLLQFPTFGVVAFTFIMADWLL